MFPFLEDVLLRAVDGTFVSGSSPNGFAITLTGSDTLCLVNSGGFVLPLTVTFGGIPCPRDASLSNASFYCVTTPTLYDLCAGSEMCQNRGAYLGLGVVNGALNTSG